MFAIRQLKNIFRKKFGFHENLHLHLRVRQKFSRAVFVAQIKIMQREFFIFHPVAQIRVARRQTAAEAPQRPAQKLPD